MLQDEEWAAYIKLVSSLLMDSLLPDNAKTTSDANAWTVLTENMHSWITESTSEEGGYF